MKNHLEKSSHLEGPQEGPRPSERGLGGKEELPAFWQTLPLFGERGAPKLNLNWGTEKNPDSNPFRMKKEGGGEKKIEENINCFYRMGAEDEKEGRRGGGMSPSTQFSLVTEKRLERL